MTKRILNWAMLFSVLGNLFLPFSALAASPTAPFFELCVAPSNGGDCSGDGNGALNTFFVGQTFSAQIRMSTNSINTKSANVIIGYDASYLSVNDSKPGIAGTQIQAGSLYESYPDSGNTVSAGIIKLTGANISGSNYNGTGIFGVINFTVIAQKVTPLLTTIDFTPGSTIDSNIVRSGDSVDILSSVENSQWNLLPDSGKPYVDTLNYPDGSANVPVESNIVFHIKDDETGVNTSTINVLISEGGGAGVNRNSWVIASCSGLWGTNDCTMTINPADIGNRNWNYNTSYNILVRDGRDRASVSQSPAGPNVMDDYSFAFATEVDADAPSLSAASPTGGAEPVNSNISFRVSDVKTSVPVNGTQGTGINMNTISVNVTSVSGLKNYVCGDGNTTCTPVVANSLTWAYDVSVDPTDDYSQNEQVLVSVTNVADNSSPTHIMDNYNWSFWTIDLTAPVISDWNPAKGANNLTPTTPVTFHVTDNGVGVDINTLSVKIGEDVYTLLGENSFDYTGDASDYFVSVAPKTSYTADKPVAITINVADNSGNTLTPEDLYAVVYDIDPVAPTCPICPDCSAKGGNTGNCSAGTSSVITSENIIEHIKEVPVDRVVEKLVENPQSVSEMRKQLSELDTTFKKETEKVSAVMKINDFEIKDKEKTVLIWGGKYISISGHTLPHANITVVAYSDPQKSETTSDSRGDFSVRLDNNFSKSTHIVFLDINKEQSDSGYLYGAKFYVIPTWVKIMLPLLSIVLAVLIIVGWRRWKRARRK